jgi:hypothetical protein
MGPASRFRVFPLYHQVEVLDAVDVDCPQWETGEERVLASAQCIVLATRPDLRARSGSMCGSALARWRSR